jgi:NAD(P)-dependent dehydrogenase (short-subunit alcohol dehydrogenase family)
MNAPIALVTGATSGIGTHIASQLAGHGWTVLVGARDAERGARAASQLGGRVLPLDVIDADTIAAAAAAVGDLDVLVNNVGISLDTGAPVTVTDVEIFRRRTRPTSSAWSPSPMRLCRRCAGPHIRESSTSPAVPDRLTGAPAQPAVRLPGGWHRLRRRLPIVKDRAQRAHARRAPW